MNRHASFARAFALTSFVAVAACGSSPDEELAGRASSAVLGGAVDNDANNVVAVFLDPSTDFPQGLFCTGALIAPNVVLTARHCVSALDGPHGEPQCEDTTSAAANRVKAPVAPGSIGIVNTGDAYASKPARATRIVVLPDSDGQILCGADVALLVLASPLDAKPIALRLDGPPEKSTTFTAVGYGYDGADTSTAGIRRSRSGLKVLSVGERREVRPAKLFALASEWTADKGPCGGDSGSPAIDTEGRIVGVMSRGAPTLCENMTYGRVDVIADWLRESVRQASVDASLEVPAWAAKPADTTAAAPAAAPDSGCAIAPATRGDESHRARTFLFVVLAGMIAMRARSRRASRQELSAKPRGSRP
jgi:hypothetical protein